MLFRERREKEERNYMSASFTCEAIGGPRTRAFLAVKAQQHRPSRGEGFGIVGYVAKFELSPPRCRVEEGGAAHSTVLRHLELVQKNIYYISFKIFQKH